MGKPGAATVGPWRQVRGRGLGCRLGGGRMELGDFSLAQGAIEDRDFIEPSLEVALSTAAAPEEEAVGIGGGRGDREGLAEGLPVEIDADVVTAAHQRKVMPSPAGDLGGAQRQNLLLPAGAQHELARA